MHRSSIDLLLVYAPVNLLAILFWLGVGLMMGAVLSTSGWQLGVFCLGLGFAALAVVRAALSCENR